MTFKLKFKSGKEIELTKEELEELGVGQPILMPRFIEQPVLVPSVWPYRPCDPIWSGTKITITNEAKNDF